MVVMMVMTGCSEISKLSLLDGLFGGDILVMMVSMIVLGTFGPSNRRKAAGTIVVTLGVIVLCLPLTFARLLWWWVRSDFRWVTVNLLTAPQTSIGKQEMRWTWTGHTEPASPSSYAGEHAAEFAFNPRLA